MRATTKLTNPTHPIRSVRSFRSLVSLARPQVHYRRWSSRFDEWIDPSRIMRNDEEGRKQQERMHLNYEYKNRKHQGLEEENGEEDDEFEGEKGGMGDLKNFARSFRSLVRRFTTGGGAVASTSGSTQAGS